MDRLDLSNLKIGANFRDEIDTLCKKCGNLKSQCQCQKIVELKSRDSYFLWINKQKKSGKEVTLCGIFFENKEVLENLLKIIKKKMACGGVCKERLKRDFWGLELFIKKFCCHSKRNNHN